MDNQPKKSKCLIRTKNRPPAIFASDYTVPLSSSSKRPTPGIFSRSNNLVAVNSEKIDLLNILNGFAKENPSKISVPKKGSYHANPLTVSSNNSSSIMAALEPSEEQLHALLLQRFGMKDATSAFLKFGTQLGSYDLTSWPSLPSTALTSQKGSASTGDAAPQQQQQYQLPHGAKHHHSFQYDLCSGDSSSSSNTSDGYISIQRSQLMSNEVKPYKLGVHQNKLLWKENFHILPPASSHRVDCTTFSTNTNANMSGTDNTQSNSNVITMDDTSAPLPPTELFRAVPTVFRELVRNQLFLLDDHCLTYAPKQHQHEQHQQQHNQQNQQNQNNENSQNNQSNENNPTEEGPFCTTAPSVTNANVNLTTATSNSAATAESSSSSSQGSTDNNTRDTTSAPSGGLRPSSWSVGENNKTYILKQATSKMDISEIMRSMQSRPLHPVQVEDLKVKDVGRMFNIQVRMFNLFTITNCITSTKHLSVHLQDTRKH